MPRAIASLVTALPLALLAAACNPYDPDLGDVPFQCGSGSPACPDGYTCTPTSNTTDFPNGICLRNGLGPDANQQLICADDGSLEPNDMRDRAFVVPIPSAGPNYSLRGLALCPAGDVDYFQFSVTSNGTNLNVSVISVAGRAPLSLNLLATTGLVIATGASDPMTPQMVKLELANRLAVGTYILEVKAPGTEPEENNYDLEIRTCPRDTPLPCPP